MKCLARSIRLSVLLGLIGVGQAFAQEHAPGTLQDALAEKGVRQIDEGLYVKVTDTKESSSESYIAIGEAGQRALLSKLLEMRESRDQANGKGADVSASFQPSEPLDDLIARLSAPQTSRPGPVTDGTGGPFRGNCGGIDNTNNPSDPFYLQALAGGGVTGPGGASAGVWNTDATLNTTNYAHAVAVDSQGTVIGSQQTTTYGTTPATVSQLYTNGCGGSSDATITCSGASTPAISVFAHGLSNRPGCNA